MAERLVGLAVAGALGTLARYGLQLWTQPKDVSFPLGIFVVNMISCLLFGLFFGMAEHRELIGPQLRIVLLTGFVGAFSTFSTFISDTSQLGSGGELQFSILNVAVSIIGGLVLFRIGSGIGGAI